MILKKASDNFPKDGSQTPAAELALVNAVLSLLNLFAAKLPAVKGVKQYHQEITIQMPDGTTSAFTINGLKRNGRNDHMTWRAKTVPTWTRTINWTASWDARPTRM